MVAVAAAFKYKEKENKITGAKVLEQIVKDGNISNHCWYALYFIYLNI